MSDTTADRTRYSITLSDLEKKAAEWRHNNSR